MNINFHAQLNVFLRNMSTSIIFAFIINMLSIALVRSGEDYKSDIIHRSRRQLLFPNSTILQFNFGMGTPTPDKSINMNWAIQTNFQLPWNRSQIPIDIFGANSGYEGLSRKKRALVLNEDYGNDAKLYHLYKYVEDMLNIFGHNGTSCILRTLCQLGAEPLHATSKEDLLHEIASFVLNPLNDGFEDMDQESRIYMDAYQAGQEKENCVSLYNTCTLSLIDFFSKLH